MDDIAELKNELSVFNPLVDDSNIFKFLSSGFTENGVTCVIDDKNHVTLSGTSTAPITKNGFFKIDGLKPNTQYSCRIFNASGVNNSEAFYILDGGTALATVALGAPGRNGVTFTTGASIDNITTRFYIAGNQTFNNSQFNIMLKKGTIPDIYVAPNTLIAATLEDIPSQYIENTIANNFWINGSLNRLNFNAGRFPAGGFLIINQIPAGYYIAIQGFTSIIYNNNERVYDSGWILGTNIPYTLEINPALYYLFTMRKSDSGTIRDIVPAESVVITCKSLIGAMATEGTKNAAPDILPIPVKIIAHRGDDITAPQNTAPAYTAARREGIMIAENDVYGKIGNEYVMWHDPTFVRLYQMVDIEGYLMYTDGTTLYYLDPHTEQLYTRLNGVYVASAVDVSTLTRCMGEDYTCESFDYETLRRIDVGAYKGQLYAGTRIMTFEEWVMQCKKLGMYLYIDHKLTYEEADILALFNIIKAAGMVKYSSWLGLNTPFTEYLRSLDPDARVGILENPTSETAEIYAYLNTNNNIFFNGNCKVLTEAEVQLGINAGYEVETWLVDFLTMTENEVIEKINNAIEWGVSGLTLDHYSLPTLYPEYYN